MTVQLAPPLVQRFYSNNNVPLSGGLLFTYAAGTTMKVAAFTDVTGATPHENPIKLDFRGEAELWLLDGQVYDFVYAPATDTDPPTNPFRTVHGVKTVDKASVFAALIASTGASLVGWIQSGAGAIFRLIQDKLRETRSVRDYGALGDGVTDDTTSIQAAIDAVSATGGGRVRLTKGRFKTTAPIRMAQNVDLVGDGMLSSVLAPVNCHGITYDFLSSFGNSRISDLGLDGTTCETSIGIYQPGTLDDADELYGITIDNVGIRNFNIAVKFRTARNVAFTNNWFESVNGGVHLVGKCLVVSFRDNKFVYGNGCGTGTQFGILTNFFNYTSGTGLIRPEGIRITGSNTVFGFSIGIAFEGVVYGVISGADVQATNTAVRFSTVSGSLDISNNYLQVAGANGSVGIWAEPQSSVLDTKISIKGNSFTAVNTAAGTSIGIEVGDMATGNQDGLAIVDNEFHGFTLYEIANYRSGNNRIVGNRCFSADVTNSILTASVPAHRPVFIRYNDCVVAIGYDGADITSGAVRLQDNTVAGITTSSSLVDPGPSSTTIPINGLIAGTRVGAGTQVAFLATALFDTSNYVTVLGPVGGTPVSVQYGTWRALGNVNGAIGLWLRVA